MKIAFVGKGGSGKSSTSWLAVKALEDMGVHVLAVDADHNMDLTSNLGLDPENTPLMHKTEKEFMDIVGVGTSGKISTVLSQAEESLPTFTIHPKDSYTSKISTEISNNLSLINIGLGSPDVMFSGKCAHGLSGSLKYYLGLLNEKDNFVVIDSVAGADMLNYGLYAGIDAVVGVVEPHRNSVKVFEQIQDICRKSCIPCYAIINKPTDNDFYTDFTTKNNALILGEIPFDEGIMSYDFSKVKDITKNAMMSVLEKIKSLRRRGNLSTIKDFQDMKSGK
jgi:CO dehydrogenase maturation factor